MNLITLDFETYYANDYSLTKLTTESYIRDPRFQVIGFSYKINDDYPVWVSGPMQALSRKLRELNIENSALLAHNMAFDGAILSWIFGIRPKYYFDTLSMARPIMGLTVGGSLAALATAYAVGTKGTDVLNAKNLRLEDFGADQLTEYGAYCSNDVQLTYDIFQRMREDFPKKELYIIDLFMRMYCDPVLDLDRDVLERHLVAVRERKQALLDTISTVEDAKSVIMSNPKFAEMLRSLGVNPPTKTSVTTGKETYAFAKTDVGMKELLDHPDVRVQTLVAARLGTKSTIEETRTESFIGIADRGPLPVPLSYYGAHTGRASGWDKINLQNLPRGGELRQAICAPYGHTLVAVDSSQIEARMTAWLAGQDDLVKDFGRGEDIYSKFATAVYDRPITKSDKVERFVGKTCLAAGTEVLCDTGWKRIEEVTVDDRVWDGEEWVCHQGLIYNGLKQTLPLYGLWLTPDHLVWSGTEWLEAQSLAHDADALSQALVTAAGNLPSQAILPVSGTALPPLSCAVTVDALSTPLTSTTLRTSSQHGVTRAPRLLRLKSDTGATLKRYQTTVNGRASLIGWLRRSLAATFRHAVRTNTTAAEALRWQTYGAATVPSFSATPRHYPAGTTPRSIWTGLMSTAGMNPATFGSSADPRTYATNDASRTLKRRLPVYDLACAGPRNRFTVRTDAGPLIVHNCILGLGYGMGGKRLRDSLKNGAISVDMTEDETKRLVQIYRHTYGSIAALWEEAQTYLDKAVQGYEFEFGFGVTLFGTPEGIHLPNGMMVRYPNLRRVDGEYLYDARKKPTRLHGPKVIENVVQALARIVVFEQMAKIDQQLRPLDNPQALERYRVVSTVHDEVITCVPDEYASNCLQMMMQTMSTAPSWACSLPVACEGALGKSYGDCK